MTEGGTRSAWPPPTQSLQRALRFGALMLAIQVSSCAPAPADAPDAAPSSVPEETVSLSADLEVSPLAEGVWMHTTWRVIGGARIPSHGLVVVEDTTVTLIDTAWGNPETELLLEWIDSRFGRPVARTIVTHFHEDRMGGLPALRDRSIPALLSARTVALAQALRSARVDEAADEDLGPLPEPFAELEAGSAVQVGPVEVFYPGPGHTRDNLVVWVPEAGVLFGGCAVRPGESSGLGNTEDADLERWAGSIQAVLDRYGEARVVVPSHGAPGGTELLTHTIDVVR